jgi:hypothetical protein
MRQRDTNKGMKIPLSCSISNSTYENIVNILNRKGDPGKRSVAWVNTAPNATVLDLYLCTLYYACADITG